MRSFDAHVVVLGAGIRGSLFAALVSGLPGLRVTVLEHDRPGAGTTSTNHGRLHCGTWNFPYADPAETRYLVAAGAMMRGAIGVAEFQQAGHYFLEEPAAETAFLAFCSEYGIDIREVGRSEPRPELPRGDFCAVYRIPEYSFNPAAVAAAGVNVAVKSEGSRFRRGTVRRVRAVGPRFEVDLVDGGVISADLVVNTLGRWAPAVDYDMPIPFPAVDHIRWRLLAVDRGPSGAGESVVTVHGRERSLAAVPHGRWTVFGCDPPVDVLAGEERFAHHSGLVPFRPDHPVDGFLYEAHLPYFADCLGTPEALWTFAGVSLEPAAVGTSTAPYPAGELLFHPDCPRHLVSFGGSATTSLADMRGAADTVLGELGVADGLPADHVDRVLRAVAEESRHGRGMAWETS